MSSHAHVAGPVTARALTHIPATGARRATEMCAEPEYQVVHSLVLGTSEEH